jgi:hypothetical protein
LRTAAAAALAAGVAGIATYFGVATPLLRERDAAVAARDAAVAEGERLERAVSVRDGEIQRLEREAARQTETVRMLRSPDVQVVPLRATDAQPGAAGRLFFDRARKRWYFHAAGMRPAGAGKTYELWLIDAAQQKIPAGLFDPDASGEVSIEVAVPEGASGFALAAVTDEPAGGVPQPTGQIQLVGEL